MCLRSHSGLQMMGWGLGSRHGYFQPGLHFPTLPKNSSPGLVLGTGHFMPTPFTEQQSEAKGEASLAEDCPSGQRLAGT